MSNFWFTEPLLWSNLIVLYTKIEQRFSKSSSPRTKVTIRKRYMSAFDANTNINISLVPYVGGDFYRDNFIGTCLSNVLFFSHVSWHSNDLCDTFEWGCCEPFFVFLKSNMPPNSQKWIHAKSWKLQLEWFGRRWRSKRMWRMKGVWNRQW